MAKRVQSEEIIQPDITRDARDSFEKFEKRLNAVSSIIKEINDSIADLRKNAATIKSGLFDLGKSNSKDLDARNKAQKVSNQLAKEAVEAEQLRAKWQKDYERLEAEREKRLKRLSDQEAKAHAKREQQYNKEIQRAQEQNRAYNQLASGLNEMRKRYKDLQATQVQGNKLTREERNEMRALASQISQTDATIKKIDASAGQFQRNVGNYPKVIGGVRSALGQLGVAFGVFELGRSFFGQLTDFENAVASFRTIVSDLNDKEFERYKSQIKSVAEETKRSNTEIAQSFEVIAGLNSKFAETEKGLGDVSKAVSTLSKASRDDLANSASNLVGIMNQFDLAADQADRTANVLAAGQAVGASSITQSAEAYKNFGAVAKSANITLEQSQALIQVLGKNTIFGAEAGTKLRGVTLQLQKAQLGYASGVFNINDALAEFNEKMNAKSTASEKDAYATKVFGAENITAGKIISSNIALFNEYTKAVTGTNEAQKAADINSNTLTERYKEFTNALSNSITTNNSANSTINILKDSLKFLTENLDTVLELVYQGIKAWITYKVVLKSLDIQSAYRDWKQFGGSISDVTKGLKDGGIAGQRFGQALKGIGWTALISLASELAMEYFNIASGANLAAERAKAFEKAQSRGVENAGKITKKYSDSLKAQMQAIDKMEGKSDLERTKLRKESVESIRKEVEDKIKFYEKEYEETQKLRSKAIKNRDDIKKQFSIGGSEVGMDIASDATIAGAQSYVTSFTAREKRQRSTLQELRSYLVSISDQTHQLTLEENANTKAEKENTKGKKALNTQLNEQNEYLSKQTELLHELDQLQFEANIDGIDSKIEELRKKAGEIAELTGKVDIGDIKQLIQERADIEQQALNDRIDFEIAAIRERYRIEKEEARKALESNRDELLSQDNLTADARAKIEADYQRKLAEFENDNLQRNGDMELEIQIVKRKSAKEQVEIEKKKNDEITETIEDLNAKQEEFAEKTREKVTELNKKTYDDERKYIELTTKFLEDQIDRRIALLEKESQAHEKQQDYFRELAATGNINAQQSLAEEARLQREADAEKERLERRKAQIQAIGAFLTSYTNKLEEGKDGTVALTEALAEKAVLESILKTIPAFKDGGEHKGGLMKVNDAPGSNFREVIELPTGETFSPEGRNVIMNAPKGTKIYTPNQWDEMNNKMRANDAFRKANSLGGNTAGTTFDIMPMVKEIRSLKKLIKDQPDRSHEVEEIVNGVLNFIVTERKGTITRKTKHQFRKNS